MLESTDWRATPLGPAAGWPPSLRIAVGICLSSRFPMFVWWGEALIQIYNDACIPMLGARHPAAFGRPAQAVWHDIWPVVGPQAAQVMQDGRATWNERVPLRMDRDGFPEDTWFTWSYSAVADEHGGIGGVFCACTEETARVRLEGERVQLLQRAEQESARLTAAMAERALSEVRDRFIISLDEAVRPLGDPAEITAVCARLLGEHLSADRCAYAEVLDDEDTFDLTGDYNRGVPSIVGRYRFADFGAQVLALMRSGRPYVVDDVDAHEPPVGDVAAYRATLIRAVICVPLHKDGRFVAAMAVHQRTPRHWRSDEVELVMHVTNRCREALERAQAVRRLRESEERFRAASTIAASIVWTNDAEGRMVGEQPGWQAFTGQSREACQGYGWADAVHPDDVAPTVAAWELAVVTGGEFVHRHRVRRADGAWRTCTIRALPLESGIAGARGWVGVHTDITERLAFEQALQESETRFRDISDIAPVMMWVTRPDGFCEYLNRRWFEFTGQRPAEALGFGWLDAVHPDDAAEAEAAFAQARADRVPFSVEYRLRRHDGQYRWCIDAAVPRLRAAGEPPGFIGSVIDITDRKRVEHVLTAEKHALELSAGGAPLAAALEAIVVGIETQSAEGLRGAILVADASGERLRTGAAPSMPAAFRAGIDGLRIATGEGTCGWAARERKLALATDIASDARWQGLHELAAEHGVRAACSLPVIDAAGRLRGTVALYYGHPCLPSEHDIELARSATHLAGIVLEKDRLDGQIKRSLAAEQTARAEAEHASRMKDEFLATLSHELRTPLHSILGWVALLRMKGELAATAAQGIDVIERNARAQAQIIADLLDMSGIISGKVSLDAQRVELGAIARLAIEAARPAAGARRIALSLRTDDAGPLDLTGDANRLQQVLWNLLTNAVKFSPEGGAVEMRLARAGGGADGPREAQITVSDAGEGIAAEFLPFVFDRFRQADASTTRRHGGLGLGLSIVRKLVELHGGAVEARSPGLGGGSCFVVRLPLLPDQPAEGRRSEGPATAPAHAEAPPAADISGLKVLLVDDDRDGRLMAQRLLEEGRAIVTAAASAPAAIALLRGQRFDVLVSDIGMPGMDGHELMQRVRALAAAEGGDIASVALTAYARPEDEARALEAGFQRHVAKPVDAAELMSAVAGAARGSSAAR